MCDISRLEPENMFRDTEMDVSWLWVSLRTITFNTFLRFMSLACLGHVAINVPGSAVCTRPYVKSSLPDSYPKYWVPRQAVMKAVINNTILIFIVGTSMAKGNYRSFKVIHTIQVSFSYHYLIIYDIQPELKTPLKLQAPTCRTESGGQQP